MIPNFLCIGSERCASTWLYYVLEKHPEIKVSRPKELKFFSKNFISQSFQDYFSHFDPEEGEDIKPLRGEMSVQYARLSIRRVKTIKKLLPDLKIIFLIRNPIDRTWSAACSEFGHIRGRKLQNIADLEYMVYSLRPRSLQYSNYYRTLKIWKKVFGKDAVLICLSEEIRKNPEIQIQKILSHIGASHHEISSDVISYEVNSTSQRTKQSRYEIPASLEWCLSRQFLDQTIKLNLLLGGELEHWVEKISILSKHPKIEWYLQYYMVKFMLGVPEKIAWLLLESFRDIALYYKTLMHKVNV